MSALAVVEALVSGEKRRGEGEKKSEKRDIAT